jgi:fructose-1,6-bisphosphatase/inositol monophosphatase family enzyme
MAATGLTLPAGWNFGRGYAPQVTDEEVVQLLRRAAMAVRGAVTGLAHRGLSGQRVSQYVADLAADAAALDVLLAGGLRVVSEESGRSGEGELVCVLDPIDGSTNFDRGIPFYSTSLCVLDGDGMRCSVVVNHATDTWYEAVRGAGATKDGERTATSGTEELARAIVSCAGTPTHNPGWAQFRALGSAALELCAVGDGSLDAFALASGARLHPWDYLGGLLVAQESGAVVRDLDGRTLVTDDVEPRRLLAAATPALFDRLFAFASPTSAGGP